MARHVFFCVINTTNKPKTRKFCGKTCAHRVHNVFTVLLIRFKFLQLSHTENGNDWYIPMLRTLVLMWEWSDASFACEFDTISIKYMIFFWVFQIVSIHAKRAFNKTIAAQRESEVNDDILTMFLCLRKKIFCRLRACLKMWGQDPRRAMGGFRRG